MEEYELLRPFFVDQGCYWIVNTDLEAIMVFHVDQLSCHFELFVVRLSILKLLLDLLPVEA